jgi:hypothetical protein
MSGRKEPEKLISRATLAMRLDRTVRTIQRWEDELGLPCYRMSGSVLFDWGVDYELSPSGSVVELAYPPRLGRAAGAHELHRRLCGVW